MLKCYVYAKCSTCRDAIAWLKQNNISAELHEIRETPPTADELALAFAKLGDIRKLLNTSGMDYREMGLKDQLPHMTTAEIFRLISENGNLCKRPFLVDSQKNLVICGFKNEQWAALFAKE